MPIYVYRCNSCGENTEVLQKVSDAPLSICPHCQVQDMRKVIAPVGVIFKGSGFHKNDYTGSGGAAKKSGDSSTGSTSTATESGGEKKSDSGGESSKSESSSTTPSSPASGDSGGSGKVA